MEPYDHREEIFGTAFLVFCVFKDAVSPGVENENDGGKRIDVPVLIVYILPLRKTSLLAAISRARISSLRRITSYPDGFILYHLRSLMIMIHPLSVSPYGLLNFGSFAMLLARRRDIPPRLSLATAADERGRQLVHRSSRSRCV